MRIPWAHSYRHNTAADGLQPAVDSTPLTLLFKLGIAGSLLVAGIFAWFVFRLKTTYLRITSPEERIAFGTMLLGIIAALAVSMVQANLLASRFVLVFIVWAVLLVTYRDSYSVSHSGS